MSKKYISLLLVICLAIGLLSGCGQKAEPEQETASPQNGSEASQETGTMKSNKINLAHTGAICEAPFFMAYEKGFFKDEGLDVTLIQGNAAFRKEGVATGKLDATDTVLLGMLKPFDEGMDIKLTAGIHTGCMDIVVAADSPIKSINDLKGKTIGVAGQMGSGGHMFALSAILEAGLNETDMTWRAYPNPECLIALQKGEIDAAASGDLLAETWIRDGEVRMLVSMALDEPFGKETCCHLAVNGKRLREDPEAIKRLTRAVVRGAEWVDQNRAEAIKIMLDKKYTQGDQELNLKILNTYTYQSDGATGKQAVREAARRFVQGGLFPADYDSEALLDRIYVDLSGK